MRIPVCDIHVKGKRAAVPAGRDSSIARAIFQSPWIGGHTRPCEVLLIGNREGRVRRNARGVVGNHMAVRAIHSVPIPLRGSIRADEAGLGLIDDQRDGRRGIGVIGRIGRSERYRQGRASRRGNRPGRRRIHERSRYESGRVQLQRAQGGSRRDRSRGRPCEYRRCLGYRHGAIHKAERIIRRAQIPLGHRDRIGSHRTRSRRARRERGSARQNGGRVGADEAGVARRKCGVGLAEYPRRRSRADGQSRLRDADLYCLRGAGVVHRVGWSERHRKGLTSDRQHRAGRRGVDKRAGQRRTVVGSRGVQLRAQGRAVGDRSRSRPSDRRMKVPSSRSRQGHRLGAASDAAGIVRHGQGCGSRTRGRRSKCNGDRARRACRKGAGKGTAGIGPFDEFARVRAADRDAESQRTSRAVAERSCGRSARDVFLLASEIQGSGQKIDSRRRRRACRYEEGIRGYVADERAALRTGIRRRGGLAFRRVGVHGVDARGQCGRAAAECAGTLADARTPRTQPTIHLIENCVGRAGG